MKFIVSTLDRDKRLVATDTELDNSTVAVAERDAQRFAEWHALELRAPLHISRQDAGITEILRTVQP